MSNVIEPIVEVDDKPKRKVGRPCLSNIHETGKEYFRQYYHASNRDMLHLRRHSKKNSMRIHLASKKHFFVMYHKELEAAKASKVEVSEV